MAMPLTSDELLRTDRQVVWHAFTQMAEYEPLVIERAEGCTLIDIHGRRYLDGAASMWCNVHGHRHPRIDAAIRAQLEHVAHVTNLGLSNRSAIELAQRLVELAPRGLNHVFFAGDGASAVEAALKMAFQYWRQRKDPRPGKSLYIAYADAYHGDTIGSVSVGGVSHFHAMFQPLLFETIRLPAPQFYRLPEGATRETACGHYLAQLEKALAANHEQVAAVVIEPLVQGAAGMVMHPPGYLRGVRELTRRYGVLLIADEITVGMGRLGTMFACEQENVMPDLLCLGKGLSGGYLPISATLATSEIWNVFLGDYAELKTFFHGHTYGGNPLASAAALATLDVFDEEQTLARLPEKFERIRSHLAPLGDHPHVGDVRQRGMIAAVELVADKATKTPYPWQERRGAIVCRHAMDEGVWIRPLGNVVYLLPPLSVSLDEIDRMCGAIIRGTEKAVGN
jgi:adenosylmethionine-8-amino-7-oxononanoate aminotransferase